MSKQTEYIRMRLNIIKMEDLRALVKLKNKKEIISKVKDFDFSEEDSKVILQRCEKRFSRAVRRRKHVSYI